MRLTDLKTQQQLGVVLTELELVSSFKDSCSQVVGKLLKAVIVRQYELVEACVCLHRRVRQ